MATTNERDHRVEGHITRAAFPLPDLTWPSTAEFWAGAARHELMIPVCDTCGRYRWYPMPECRHCDGRPYSWSAVSGRGTLFSWVVVTHPFLPQFADLVPFVPALVALDEDPGVRVPTRMVGCEPADLTFDMPVRVTFREIAFTGVTRSVTAPLFVPT
ncbi:MAG: Zn-ribbon domain-containing OB-fold protein [Actinomycetota bacterium]